MKRILLCFLASCMGQFVWAQNCSSLNFQLQGEIPTVCSSMTMTMLQDRNDLPYLYVANKEAGLMIYDITDFSSPVFVKQFPIDLYDSLHVMNVTQHENYLYLALGNTFTADQASGMAIIDVQNPVNSFLTDYYVLPGSVGGSGIVVSTGNYTYVGAMGNGILTLNTEDKTDIQEISQYIPPQNFPDANPDLTKINARGLAVRNDTLYVCYDAGGFRILDYTNKNNPFEVGRYSNPLMNGLPRAYNNLELNGDLAYVAVDYCGLEILDFSDPANISLAGWWNPYDCPGNNWFSSPVHANEIRFNPSCELVFLSTGKSDLMVVDVSDPTAPDSCNFYGGVSNGIGTWGIDVYQNHLFLSYVCAVVPFTSLWTGVKALNFSPCSANLENLSREVDISIYPNPAMGIVEIELQDAVLWQTALFDLSGKEIYVQRNQVSENSLSLDLSHVEHGIYLLKLMQEHGKIVIQKIQKD